MKKLWLFLLSLGLVMAFSVSAFAADVKFSGEYYAAGLYLNHVDLRDEAPGTVFTRSTAFFYQRLRLGTDFVVSPCLRLVTRMDIMERTWEPDSEAYYDTGSYDRNLDFDMAYIDYTSPIGLFQVGYMLDYAWGTIWGKRTTGPTAGQIKYVLPFNFGNTGLKLVAVYAKEEENDYFVDNTGVVANDRDYDSYRVGPIFDWKGNNFSGEAGVLFIYNQVRQYRTLPLTPLTAPFKQDMYVVQPYFKAKAGPVTMQGEINYAWGDRDFETPLVDDQAINSFTAWLDADAKFGIVSIGGSLAFVQGQDPDDTDEINNALTGGRDWDPCLIMFNNTTANSWVGQVRTYTNNGAYMTGPIGEMKNAWFVQGRIGVTPIPKLTFTGSLSYAGTHESPVNALGNEYDDDYGWELDITGTYKITNNLSYMLGGAYFWTGDYFQAGYDTNDLTDDYMIINKLTLNF